MDEELLEDVTQRPGKDAGKEPLAQAYPVGAAARRERNDC